MRLICVQDNAIEYIVIRNKARYVFDHEIQSGFFELWKNYNEYIIRSKNEKDNNYSIFDYRFI